MGFYIRKSIKLGPLRLNLSKSGVGASVGVKGARIGTGPKGAYVHAGRHGIYYRKQLGKTNVATLPTPQNIPENKDVPVEIKMDGAIESADVTELSSEAHQEMLNTLNAVQSYRNKASFFLAFAIVILIVLSFTKLPIYMLAFDGILSVVIWILLLKRDKRLNTFHLTYELDDSLSNKYDKFTDNFQTFSSSEGIWNIDAIGETNDLKRSGGAATSLDRTTVSPTFALPKRVSCNLRVPMLPAGNETLYFFPDRILIHQNGKIGAISYDEVEIELSESNFLEENIVPDDAEQVGTTWKYINKKGGPDKRFKHNYEIPVMKYGEMHLTSKSGLNELFMYSNIGMGDVLRDALISMRAVH